MKKVLQKTTIIIIIVCYIFLIGLSFVRPLFMKNIMDEGLIHSDLQVIFVFSVLLVVLSFVEELITLLQTRLCIDLKNDIVLKLYLKVFRKLLRVENSYFSKNHSAEIINKITTDINSIGTLIDSSMISVIGYVLQVISGVAGLVFISWKLAIIVLLVIPVKYCFTTFFSRKREDAVEKWIQESTDFSAWLDDTLGGIREIKLWNLQNSKKQRMVKKQKRVLDSEKRSRLLDAYNQSGDVFLQWLIVGGLYAAGGYFVFRENLTVGGLTAFISYSNYVIGPIAIIMNLKFLIAQIKPSISRLFDFFQETEEDDLAGQTIETFRNAITFSNVEFSYGTHKVVESVDIEIKKGEKVAFIGENGSGKSTLIKMLLRFETPSKGKINIDGEDIQKYRLQQYRNLFAVVSQDVYLFHDTIRNNILMDRDLSNDALDRICKIWNLKNFIQEDPEGYERILEKNGGNISGGERQKIALLRAIIKNAEILILDEATANIDKEYDNFLQKKLLDYSKEKTVIMITHKWDNLQRMDRIYQIEDHQIKEISYEQLEKGASLCQPKEKEKPAFVSGHVDQPS